jgi:hypothetical protein
MADEKVVYGDAATMPDWRPSLALALPTALQVAEARAERLLNDTGSPTAEVYVYLDPNGSVARTVEIAPGVMADYATDGTLLGVELLRATGLTIDGDAVDL